MTTLHDAASSGDLVTLIQLIEHGADVNELDKRGCTPAMVATYANQPSTVAALFQHGADPNLRDAMLNSPFLYSGAEGYLDILHLANEAGADPTVLNRYGGTALIPACERGHIDVIRYLLEHTRIDINHVNNLGWTGLMEAIILADGGSIQQNVVQILIDHDADVNIPDSDGVTPLAHARRRGFSEIVDILVRAGASARTGLRHQRA